MSRCGLSPRQMSSSGYQKGFASARTACDMTHEPRTGVKCGGSESCTTAALPLVLAIKGMTQGASASHMLDTYLYQCGIKRATCSAVCAKRCGGKQEERGLDGASIVCALPPLLLPKQDKLVFALVSTLRDTFDGDDLSSTCVRCHGAAHMRPRA